MSENPYAAPQAEVPPPPLPSARLTSPYGPYREVGGLRTAILICLGLGMALSGISIYFSQAVNRAITTVVDDDDQKIDQLIDLSSQISNLEIIVFLITVIPWCVWKNKSCKNAWLFQPAPVRSAFGLPISNQEVITPGWAAGSYFVPILNLWKPFQAMAFIRDQVSSKLTIGPLVGLWWISYLTMNFATRYFTRATEAEFSTNAEAIAYNQGLMINSGIEIVAALLAAAVIHKLTVGQQQIARERGLTL